MEGRMNVGHGISKCRCGAVGSVLCVTHVWAVATFLYFILAECPPFGWVPSIPFES